MRHQIKRPPRRITLLHALVEISGIIFLFYANLLMGEFNRSAGARKSFSAALYDVVTLRNFAIAFFTATCGFVVFNYFRLRLRALEEEAATTLGL